MTDLKRVYQDLQEENESYEILLGERTLNGEVRGTELFRQSFQWGESGEEGPAHGLGFLGGLEAVGEGDEDDFSDLEGESDEDEDDVDRILLESKGVGSPNEGAVSAGASTRRGSRQASKKKRPSGGLDLAAELEAAQMEDSDAEEKERKKQAKLERRRASQARRGSTGQGAGGERRGSVMPMPGSIEGESARLLRSCSTDVDPSHTPQSSAARSRGCARPTRRSPYTSPRLSTASARKKASRRSSPSITAWAHPNLLASLPLSRLPCPTSPNSAPGPSSARPPPPSLRQQRTLDRRTRISRRLARQERRARLRVAAIARAGSDGIRSHPSLPALFRATRRRLRRHRLAERLSLLPCRG